MKRRKFPFSNEDTTLWKRVADSTTALSKQRGQFLKEEMAKLMEQASPPMVRGVNQPPTMPAKPKAAGYQIPQSPKALQTNGGQLSHHPIEEHIAKKLAKGRLSIDSRIDLHGMTQDRARFALLDFLQMAQSSDYRIILVITGKGNEGQGVLRRNVPQWLLLPNFASLINGFRPSHASHGGEGALYVRIRKPNNRARR